MKRATLLSTAIFAMTVILASVARAQDPDPPSKIEVGIQFSSLTFRPPQPPNSAIFVGITTEAGFGGRFTFNLNKHVSLEAEGNFFPHESFNDPAGRGRVLQGQFGVKAGKRFGKFGIFAKARPGFLSFSKALTVIGTATYFDFNGQPFTYPVFGERRKTRFSMDLGGVLEFYPSRKLLTRIDVGDTIVFHGADSLFPFGLSVRPRNRTDHNVQVSAGIGFRFGSLPPKEITPVANNHREKRFEVGGQFSSLVLREVEHFPVGIPLFSPGADYYDTVSQPGFGGRFTYNLTPNFALEVQSDFYPTEVRLINNGRAGGRILQGQAGVKAGKRFEKFGVFAKARPGVVSFAKSIEVSGIDPTFGFPIFRQTRKNYFSMDLGGVLEFYPSPRIVTRFDGGDTMIRYRSTELPIVFFPTTQSLHVPAETTHNFQFSAGVGFRF